MTNEHEQVEDLVAARTERGRHPGGFGVAIAEGNFQFREIFLRDPVPTGQQVLEQAGFRLPTEHILLQVLADGALEELRLEETTQLLGRGSERFIVFKSDRTFRLQVNERRYEWGATPIAGSVVRQIVGGDAGCDGVWLERTTEPDLFVGEEDMVQLSGEGVERFRVGRIFWVCIEGTEIPWQRNTITTEEVIRLGGWDPGLGAQVIDLMTNEARTLQPGEEVQLKPGQGFAKKIRFHRG